MQDIETLNSDLDSISVAKSFICDITEATRYVSSLSTLNLLTQNIRSISCNLPNLTTLLERSDLKWDILVLTECWLPAAKYIPTLDSYTYIATTHNRTKIEGVVIYYDSQLVISSEEPELCDANCMLLKLGPDTCIIGIYRSPSQTNTTNFINSLDLLLHKLNKFKNIILCGDINIDIGPDSIDNSKNEYLNVLASHGLLAGHIAPTRHGRHRSTCLDHMMLKTKLEATCLIFESSITDHECVAACFTLTKSLEHRNAKTF